ncbi:MAG: MaoC family dehydratase N-terminal domain-containing protein [bacterium]
MVSLPNDLAADEERRLSDLLVESPAVEAPLEVSESLIRHWCEAFDDANPLYLDRPCAQASGFADLVAPPAAVLSTFALGFRYPPPRQPLPRNVHYAVKDVLGFPHAVISAIDAEHATVVEVGERVAISQRLVSVTAWKSTRRGAGRFWTIEQVFRGRNGEIVARQRMTAFGYGRVRKAEVAPASRADDGLGGPPPAAPRQPVDRCWEDATEGDPLPPLTMPITPTRCVYVASATRDFGVQHSVASAQTPAGKPFVNTPFLLGIAGRFLTDWGGPASRVRRVRLAMKENLYAGDVLHLAGHIAGKHVSGGRGLVEIELSIQNAHAEVTHGIADLELPMRRG